MQEHDLIMRPMRWSIALAFVGGCLGNSAPAHVGAGTEKAVRSANSPTLARTLSDVNIARDDRTSGAAGSLDDRASANARSPDALLASRTAGPDVCRKENRFRLQTFADDGGSGYTRYDDTGAAIPSLIATRVHPDANADASSRALDDAQLVEVQFLSSWNGDLNADGIPDKIVQFAALYSSYGDCPWAVLVGCGSGEFVSVFPLNRYVVTFEPGKTSTTIARQRWLDLVTDIRLEGAHWEHVTWRFDGKKYVRAHATQH